MIEKCFNHFNSPIFQFIHIFILFSLDDCSYDDAIFCLPEVEDIIGNCLLSADIEACIIDELGDGNNCISCVCAILEMINLSC